MTIIQSAIVSPETTWADLYNHWPQNRRAGSETSQKTDKETTNNAPRIRETLKHSRSLEEVTRETCAELIA